MFSELIKVSQLKNLSACLTVLKGKELNTKKTQKLLNSFFQKPSKDEEKSKDVEVNFD